MDFYGFLDMCEFWKLWECNGSSIERLQTLFQASTAAQSDDCLPANSKQRTRYRIMSALSASDCLALQTPTRHLQ